MFCRRETLTIFCYYGQRHRAASPSPQPGEIGFLTRSRLQLIWDVTVCMGSGLTVSTGSCLSVLQSSKTDMDYLESLTSCSLLLDWLGKESQAHPLPPRRDFLCERRSLSVRAVWLCVEGTDKVTRSQQSVTTGESVQTAQVADRLARAKKHLEYRP